jgi:threonine/homoserine/homoserine lactone efflux protein
MILELLNKNYDAIIMQLMLVFVAWMIVLLSIGIDLYFGIKKSKKKGVYTHSFGLRKTSEKSVQYLAFMFFMLFIDILNPLWAYVDFLPLPLLSIFGAIVLVYTEWKSVREKSNEKFRNDLGVNAKELLSHIQDLKSEISNLKKE